MNNSWIKSAIELPAVFSVMGIGVSEYVLVCTADKSFGIASLWLVDNEYTWRSCGEGRRLGEITHWKHIKGPN